MRPPVKELRATFDYDPLTGVLIRKKNRCCNFVGKRAGGPTPHGYWTVAVNGRRFLLHVVAWAIYYGRWPRFMLDHKNLDKADNSINNLRPADKSKNGANRPPQKNNTSGYKGVFWHKGGKKWMVQIRARGQLIYLGLFETKEQARVAYREAAEKYFGVFARAA